MLESKSFRLIPKSLGSVEAWHAGDAQQTPPSGVSRRWKSPLPSTSVFRCWTSTDPRSVHLGRRAGYLGARSSGRSRCLDRMPEEGHRSARLRRCAGSGAGHHAAIGRCGNYFNQELYGKVTSLPWALRIDPAHRPAETLDASLYHPAFLYESLWNLGVAAVLIWAERRYRLGHGRLFALLYSRIHPRPGLDRSTSGGRREPYSRPAAQRDHLPSRACLPLARLTTARDNRQEHKAGRRHRSRRRG